MFSTAGISRKNRSEIVVGNALLYFWMQLPRIPFFIVNLVLDSGTYILSQYFGLGIEV